MTLNDFVSNLVKLQEQGHGDLEVFYRHGASGDCGELSYPHISDQFDDYGPFDINEGDQYISIYAGN